MRGWRRRIRFRLATAAAAATDLLLWISRELHIRAATPSSPSVVVDTAGFSTLPRSPSAAY
eukprot:scaffold14726_cov146-Skeletonema_menzelii.AAC.4